MRALASQPFTDVLATKVPIERYYEYVMHYVMRYVMHYVMHQGAHRALL